ncbi:MAG TPA: DNA-3-methyladenine glycosylase I [Nitrospirota bacterium]|nr:DNA-3-methyladenine glycosylase I [Nitrospirota bacterium]
MQKSMKRCAWVSDDPLMITYHDREWGVPLYNDRKLFELLILEGAQAGLAWVTVLRKRENFRKAFHGFDSTVIARYSKKNVKRLLDDPGIIRNRLKIEATIINAKKFLEVQNEFGSFHEYIWQFAGGKPIKHKFKSPSEIPSTTEESDAMSRDLRKRGFRFVGSTICYAFMQATGMVNDHTTDCFRYKAVSRAE